MATRRVDDDIRRIRALRLRAQGLVPQVQPWSSAADVARGMLAMQAQDADAVRWALALRAQDAPDDASVAADLAGGSIVRNRPSRGTLQVTAPEDLHWLSAALTARSRAESARRRATLGITDDDVSAAESIVRSALAGGTSLARADVIAACARAGLALDSSQAGHVLRDLTEAMVIVFAAPQGKSDAFALADDWIGDRRVPDAPLGEMVSRFVTSRGAVTRQDIGKWAHLPMGVVDDAISAAGGAVERARLSDTDFLVATGTADLSNEEIDEALSRPLLLPGFDEYIIGYGSRAAHLDETFLDRIIPGRNGVFRPMVVIGGEIVGVWSKKVTAKSATVSIEPFRSITASDRRRLRPAVREYGRFLGREATLAD